MFDQSPYTCRVEWGRRGAREAADHGDIVIIVDVLSFSSTVISALNYDAMGAFHHAEPKLEELIWDCGSGRELRDRGFGADVKHCSTLNVYQIVPLLKNNHFVRFIQ